MFIVQDGYAENKLPKFHGYPPPNKLWHEQKFHDISIYIKYDSSL